MQSNGVKYPLNPDFYFLERTAQSTLRHLQPTTELGLSLHSPLSSLHRNERSAALLRLRALTARFLNQDLLIPAFERVRLVSLTDVHLNHCHCLLDQKVQWEDPRESDCCNCSLTIIVKAGRHILCCQYQKSKGGRELSV